MKVKDFGEKYGINLEKAMVYDGLLRSSKAFKELPTEADARDGELNRLDFVHDFMELEY